VINKSFKYVVYKTLGQIMVHGFLNKF